MRKFEPKRTLGVLGFMLSAFMVVIGIGIGIGRGMGSSTPSERYKGRLEFHGIRGKSLDILGNEVIENIKAKQVRDDSEIIVYPKPIRLRLRFIGYNKDKLVIYDIPEWECEWEIVRDE